MGENSAEQSEGKQNIEKLQKEFAIFVERSHGLAAHAFGTGGRLRKATHNKEAVGELASHCLNKFDLLYRAIPEGHHLDIGLNPLTWYQLTKDENLKPLLRKEIESDGPRYYLKVARHVQPSELQPGRSALNLIITGSNDPDYPEAKIEGMIVSNENNYKGLDTLFYPEDILTIKIVPNPQK